LGTESFVLELEDAEVAEVFNLIEGVFQTLLNVLMTFKSIAMKAPFSLLRIRELPSLADSKRRENAGCVYELASFGGATHMPSEHMFRDNEPSETSKTLLIVGDRSICCLRKV
jgi:hypothetical protein